MTRFYVTTPIYYVNDAPHVGHSYTTLNADANARWHRLLGDDVHFLTGTDEHGLKVAQSAEKNGLTPSEQADLNSARFQQAWELLNISNDDFIRTTEQRHHIAVQELLRRAHANGYIRKGTYEGFYCVGCEAYYEEDELDDGNCRVHHRPAKHMVEDNYFFALSKFEEPLRQWYAANPTAVSPDGYRNEALGIINNGLKDVSMTRTSIDWGVKVPWDPEHVFYVWFDALINYATAVGFGSDEEQFEAWWPATHHFIGKDILRFHCVYWQAMLLAAGITDLPQVRVHGFLLLGGEKMSKSGNVTAIAPSQMVDEFGVDGFRYSLLRDNSFGPDSDFSYENLLTRYNGDLANAYGNLLQRVITVVTKKCDGIGPAPSPTSPLAAVAETAVAEATDAWSQARASLALEASWRLVRDTNEYLADNEPWKMEPGPEVNTVMGDALEALRIATILASPAIPAAAAEAWRRLALPGVVEDQRVPVDTAWGGYPGGLELIAGDPLFPRIRAS